ncbi:ABC transporter ATP-binding protein [Clostridium tyrobutyricum]|uniref:Putative ABC transporter ATPase n=1 Tax=Clostridium tyrobutyricum TaxID=1519 RepID=A0A0A7HFG2_CLOTY|nr:ABC transporter ATP-binding protein [Clostridium tyrobutyricum]AIZ03673.1 putative ABC transporter ATPase [Clostridium tyrobutyricum]MBV4416197.1 ABC transporter ATP-binding protein [Clostridium tyrobutyricum]MBV4416202.1 ABC transporter ATP-binding protein [Clostridium tyrobutyricum]MBV4422833.1 ABC transporter ATP-binding protein [Clostridium tyrobutyricum]MBV4424839.1 ABC transporter ATP-binding protein [Clostridium tyrobutyricum]
MNKEYYLSMKNITKKFGDVVANNNINFNVKGGEIHALLGENGAGKSTLMNMLSGIYIPDGGSIFIHGREARFKSPTDAIKSGVGMIYQHFKLIESMTAIQNILLGNKRKIFLNYDQELKKIQKIQDKYGFDVDLNKYVYDMSVGERENLEILKVLCRGADILILDEPTAVFTPQETKKLFDLMNRMKKEGCSIIFITHKLDEVMEVADSITILRKGESVETVKKEDTTPKELVDKMIGYHVDLAIKRSNTSIGKTILKVSDLNLINDANIPVLKNINFEIHEGEVVGIAGISGCGQKELCEAIAGVTKISSGKIEFEGKDITCKDSAKLAKENIGISFVPEDRIGMGLVGSMDMVDNVLLKHYKYQKGYILKKDDMEKESQKIKDDLDVKTPNIHYPIKNLSGGNIQKILLGRELGLNPKLLLMGYPVRGLDINTCYTIYNLVNKEKEKGTGVLFVGEDLDILLNLCDRIIVMHSGEITGNFESEKATKEIIGYKMLGNNYKGDEVYENEIC